jgi:hypothetical protein
MFHAGFGLLFKLHHQSASGGVLNGFRKLTQAVNSLPAGEIVVRIAREAEDILMMKLPRLLR